MLWKAFFVISPFACFREVTGNLLSAKKNERVLQVDPVSDVILEATISVGTYSPTTCLESDITEIGSFLLGQLNTYQAQMGSLKTLSLPGMQACNNTRRYLRDTDNFSQQIYKHPNRNLGSLPGFTFKLPTTCRQCNPDNSDMRRPYNSPITIRVRTDLSPREFSYKLMTSGGSIVYASNTFTNPNTEYVETLFLDPGKVFKVVLKDLGGNGLCCRKGDGFVQVVAGTSAYGNNTLLVDTSFGSSRTHTFIAPLPTYSNSKYGSIETEYSEYLSTFLQQIYLLDKKKCMYMDFPTVTVSLQDAVNQGSNVPC